MTDQPREPGPDFTKPDAGSTPPPYGTPAQPYGTPAQPYGTPPPGYGQPAQPYGTSPGPAQYGGYGPGGGSAALADWPVRALSGLIDYVAPFIIAGVVFAINDALGYLVYLAAIAWALFQAYQGGATGQSQGKKIVGTRLLSEATGQPIGGAMGIGRYFLHIIDGIPCYIGYLWPLWDSKKQTFADKIVKTLVVKV